MYARNRFVTAVSALPPLLVGGLFYFEFYCYNFLYALKTLKNTGNAGDVVATIVLFNFTWLLGFCSFLRCTLSDPGVIPKEWQSSVQHSDTASGNIHRGWEPGVVQMCRKCNERRPERAHHCFICGRCVMRMDHHCPWVGNCIGFKNHKFFLLFGFYGSLACLVFILSALPEVQAMMLPGKRAAGAAGAQVVLGLRGRAHMLFSLSVVLACAFGVGLGTLFISHCYLAARNLTSIEMGNGGRNPYNQGVRKNVENLLGAFDLWWFLPVHPETPLSDGLSFKTATGTATSGFSSTLAVGDLEQQSPSLSPWSLSSLITYGRIVVVSSSQALE